MGFVRLGRKVILACGIGLAAVSPAAAVIGTIDEVPAATLLLPYFEVDLGGGANGFTTMFSVNNAASTAVLAHVVIWSDLSVPVLDFNLYLTGYDVQTINLRDLLVGGKLPRTASAGQDPTDTVSPHGAFSQDIDFASCAGQLPSTDLPPNFLDHLQRSLTGQASPILGGLCAGRAAGDNIARGYVTVDTVKSCTLRFPGDVGYFAPGGTGDATNQNVLWGDYFYVYPAGDAIGETLVHIEASGLDRETSVAGQYTFYGRYVGWLASDNREPLATQFAARFAVGGAFATDFVVWRDSKVNQSAFTCPEVVGLRPSWYGLGQEAIVIFDEQENPDVPQSFPVSPQPPGAALLPFPAEAQVVEIGVDLPVVPTFGWIFLDLNTAVAAAGMNPPEDPLAAQAWVTVVWSSGAGGAAGRRVLQPPPPNRKVAISHDAVKLDSATGPIHTRPGNSPQ